ncbi:MAG: translation elongation factor Ts [Candidatus Pseudoruminococcus sp.]|uniref:translation elongation factor Ts n=1 Tax=Candidatus Pseudoruminococcus sp. TaxID=3101048 RepID=UPI002A7B1AF1|nr:translation elongation factor Ts [Ruminococcus sp.]MDY2783385.1 translation elongation factor Ts [Candidatus Pseudoruminococcus sp.]
MAFTAQDVKTLREKTGCGMMDCKKALTQADGNMDAAIDILREQGLAKQAKKASRIAAEGVAYAATNADATVGVVVEINSETDFVAKNDDFMSFVKTVADTIIEKNPADVDALLAEKAAGSDMTVAELLQEKVLTIGENIKIRRFARYEGAVATYIHAGGKIGVMVNFETDVAGKDGFAEYGKDIAMQIAAVNPSYLQKSDVPDEVIEHEKAIMTEQVINEGKPEAIAQKIVLGKIGKYYEENCLVNQAFVKDNKMTVEQYTAKVAKDLGGSIKILGFVRFEKGEGLEKRSDNLADEVAKQLAESSK